MIMGKRLQDFPKAVGQIALCLLCLGFVVASGCRSGAHTGSEDSPASTAKKKSYPGTEQQQQAPADPSRTGVYPGAGQSAAGRTPSKTSSQQDTNSDSSKKEGYEGGDPDIFHPPKHYGTPIERVETTTRASTPTPTPNRPIDRPLDPAGLPLNASTPEG